MIVVFHAPVRGIAGQSVLARQCDDMPIFQMAESAVCCDPQRTALVEPEVVDTAFGQTIGRCVRCADPAVADVRDLALRPEPEAALPRVDQQRCGRISQPNRLPRYLLHHRLAVQTIETARRIDNPEIPGAIPDERRHPSCGQLADGVEPTVLEVRDPLKCRDPESPAIVLKKCVDAINGKSAIKDLAALSVPRLAPLLVCHVVAWCAV